MEFGQSLLAVDRDFDPRGLAAGAQERHLVDGQHLRDLAAGVGRHHAQRRQRHLAGLLETLQEAGFLIGIEQEAHGAEIHAVDRLQTPHVAMERLQHQPIATQRNYDVGLCCGGRPILLFEAGLGLARRRGGGANEGEAGSRRGAGGHLGVNNAWSARIVL